MGSAAELILGRDPEAVPKARRFVRSSLAGEEPSAVEDAELIVTELVTNALLHGAPPVTIRLALAGGSVRLEVQDAGRDWPIRAVNGTGSMTGRGLALVARLATDWGVDPQHPGGKSVWAELRRRPSLTGTEQDQDAPPQMPTRPPDTAEGSAVPEPIYTVILPSVPTGLLLAAKSQVDDLVRELTLARGGGKTADPPGPAVLAASVIADFAEARSQMKQQVAAAADRGDLVTDIVLRLPESFAEAALRYLAALDEADRYARASKLLTMASPLSHRVLRRWYVKAMVAQLRSQAAGLPPPPAEPLAAVLAAELDELECACPQPADG